jgi:hypothetical protein
MYQGGRARRAHNVNSFLLAIASSRAKAVSLSGFSKSSQAAVVRALTVAQLLDISAIAMTPGALGLAEGRRVCFTNRTARRTSHATKVNGLLLEDLALLRGPYHGTPSKSTVWVAV